MKPRVTRVVTQTVAVFVLLLAFYWVMTAATGRRSPWATVALVALIVIVRGVYMWRKTPPNSPAKLVK